MSCHPTKVGEGEKPGLSVTPAGNQYTMEKGFRCEHCGAYVYTLPMIAGVNNRNHCPFCLWSRHVDYLKPGDRMSACKADDAAYWIDGEAEPR